MNESQFVAKWKAIRSQGRTRYILFNGVVMWGWLTAILTSLLVCAVQGWHLLPLYLPIHLVVFSIGGYVAGTWGWARHEQNYNQLESRPTA